MRTQRVVIGLIALTLLGAACGAGSGAPPSMAASDTTPACDAGRATDESSLPVATVAIADQAFLPGCFIARGHGQTLRIKNADRTAHTFTVDGTRVDVELPAGTNAEVTGDLADLGLAPGTYPFHCRIHASMTGLMIVR